MKLYIVQRFLKLPLSIEPEMSGAVFPMKLTATWKGHIGYMPVFESLEAAMAAYPGAEFLTAVIDEPQQKADDK